MCRQGCNAMSASLHQGISLPTGAAEEARIRSADRIGGHKGGKDGGDPDGRGAPGPRRMGRARHDSR
jgi:hypothetical protein